MSNNPQKCKTKTDKASVNLQVLLGVLTVPLVSKEATSSFLLFYMVEEEHEILTLYNGQMFSLFHFQFKSANISTILTSKLNICVYGDMFLDYHLEYIFLK